MKTIIITILFCLIVLGLNANIVNIPLDYSTIQAGINAATNGDTVLVQPGTYVENIDYSGKNITVASLFITTQDPSYISQTILDGNASERVVLITNGEDSTAVLTGFTLTNGEGGILIHNESSPRVENVIITGNNCYDQFDRGGGIWIHGTSSPIIKNVTITGNSVNWGGGGGIYCEFDSSPSLKNVTITGNSCSGTGGSNGLGGGIAINSSDLSLENVIISGNTASYVGGGIYIQNWSTMSLVNVIFSGNTANQGGGIFAMYHSSLSLVNVTFSGNTADQGGGLYFRNNSDMSLVDCILWNDSPQEIYFWEENDPNSITISYSDIQGGEEGIETNDNGTVYWLEGNIDTDPLFNFLDPCSLLEGSPCIDAGDPDTLGLNLPPYDIIGNERIWDGDGNGTAIIDMGAYEYGSPPVVGVDEPIIPNSSITNYDLHNYPNPVRNSTHISYGLNKTANVTLSVYNIKGQLLDTIIQPNMEPGYHSVTYDMNDMTNGIYFCMLIVDGVEMDIRKLVLINN